MKKLKLISLVFLAIGFISCQLSYENITPKINKITGENSFSSTNDVSIDSKNNIYINTRDYLNKYSIKKITDKNIFSNVITLENIYRDNSSENIDGDYKNALLGENGFSKIKYYEKDDSIYFYDYFSKISMTKNDLNYIPLIRKIDKNGYISTVIKTYDNSQLDFYIIKQKLYFSKITSVISDDNKNNRSNIEIFDENNKLFLSKNVPYIWGNMYLFDNNNKLDFYFLGYYSDDNFINIRYLDNQLNIQSKSETKLLFYINDLGDIYIIDTFIHHNEVDAKIRVILPFLGKVRESISEFFEKIKTKEKAKLYKIKKNELLETLKNKENLTLDNKYLIGDLDITDISNFTVSNNGNFLIAFNYSEIYKVNIGG